MVLLLCLISVSDILVPNSDNQFKELDRISFDFFKYVPFVNSRPSSVWMTFGIYDGSNYELYSKI